MAAQRMSLREAIESSYSSQLPAVAADMDGSVSIEIKECGESSRSSHRSNNFLNSIMDDGNKYLRFGSQKPKIQMVQPLLREVETNKKSYDPMVVSIGPIHHGKPELKPIERLKISIVQQYVKNWGVKIDELYEEVVKVASDARKSYAEGLTEKYNDEEFTCMMFVDGCFTLHYICNIVEGNHDELKKIQHIALVRRDLLLLENQLPYIVLRVLMRASLGIALGKEIIITFIKRIRGEPSTMRTRGESSEAVTLIERLKSFVRQHSLVSEVQMQDVKDEDDNEPVHLLELVRRLFIDPKAFGIGCVISGSWYSRRSAKDFKTVGIHFKPSKTYQFTDIEFKSTRTSGILTLPRIIIDDTTKSVLLNLVVYEACPDNSNDTGVTSYVCFMDSIIDQEEDVKELRSEGIFMNYLGSDKQVADLFNDITTELAPSPHAYLLVKSGIERYVLNRPRIQVPTWVGDVMRITVLYALVDILLSSIQTYFTVFPSPDKH